MSVDARRLLDCIATMQHIEQLGQVNDTEGRTEFGWSAADSYEDSRGWALYYAGQVIGGACDDCGSLNGAHLSRCSRHPAAIAKVTGCTSHAPLSTRGYSSPKSHGLNL